jgi:hypothetical protein
MLHYQKSPRTRNIVTPSYLTTATEIFIFILASANNLRISLLESIIKQFILIKTLYCSLLRVSEKITI